MYCNYCGKSIPDDALHCAYCGKRMSGVMARRKLTRPRDGRKIAGICLGFAEYFDLDVTLVRVVWLACTLLGLCGLIAYIAAWIIVPEEPRLLPAPQGQPGRVEN